MLQMPFYNHTASIDYAAFADQYLPKEYTPTTTLAQQHDILNQKHKTGFNEQFSFVTDIKTNIIANAVGVDRCLGFANTTFSSNVYEKQIHPAHQFIQSITAKCLFEELIKNNIEVNWLQPVFVNLIALQHHNGKAFLYKKEAVPFQLAKPNKMISYLSTFTLIKEFDNEVYLTRIYNKTGALSSIEQVIKQNILNTFNKENPFSYQEFKILQLYNKIDNSTTEAVAKKLGIVKKTVDTYNTRILVKANTLFAQKFTNAKMVAAHLSKQYLI